MNWQPIDTAPKDGTWVMIYAPSAFPNKDITHWLAMWSDYYGKWTDQDDVCVASDPTHWMPLPDPPGASE